MLIMRALYVGDCNGMTIVDVQSTHVYVYCYIMMYIVT